MPKIDINDVIDDKNAVFIDVRSENEFEHDHIPCAINIPILDNEQRHIIGYTFKKISKKKGIDLGYKIFEQKKHIFENEIKKNKNKKIIFYCSRGGLRSGVFADFFNKKGINVYQLNGGYKSYRKYVREKINDIQLPDNIIVLYGNTGCAKTEIIKQLSPNAIDLEGLACHRSSIYGAIGLHPKNQKIFETSLLAELKKSRVRLILEGESRKIGNIIIPENLFNAMNNAKKINVVSSIDNRAKRILKEYFSSEKNINEIINLTPRLNKILGKKNVNELIIMLKEKEYYDFCITILEKYYDKCYMHSIKDFKFDFKVCSDNIDSAVKEIRKYCEKN